MTSALLATILMVQGGADGVALVGPSQATETVDVLVTGLPAFDDTKTWGENTSWKNDLRIHVDFPGEHQVKTTLEVDFLTSKPTLRVTVTANEPGVAVIIAAWNDPFRIVTHRVQFRGDKPEPDPDPDPDPDPTPDPTPQAADQIVIVEETGRRTPALASLFQNVRKEYDGNAYIVDKDTRIASFKPYADQAKGKDLPWLILVTDGGKPVYQGVCPGDWNSFKDLVASYGL